MAERWPWRRLGRGADLIMQHQAQGERTSPYSAAPWIPSSVSSFLPISPTRVLSRSPVHSPPLHASGAPCLSWCSASSAGAETG